MIRAVTVPARGQGVPWLTELRYEPGSLRLSLQFADAAEVAIEFDGVCGFRVLDEGDLLEFWAPETRPNGWLWRVEDGGWRALEAQRDGFILGQDTTCQEFLVVGQDECVGILARHDPTVRKG